MTFFKLLVGYECGVDKSVCPLGYPQYCGRCLNKRFSEAHFLIDVLNLVEEDSEEKRLEMNYRYIWIKYHDILNLRHIIILSKRGLPVFNMAVGDHPMDATLLSGFIQANVIFSDESLTEAEKNDISKKSIESSFYEFQYKHFNILLREGKSCRICLILDNRASENLRELLSNFTEIFEDLYKEELIKFETTSSSNPFDPVKELIEKTFEVTMIYPQSLSLQIPPNVIENFSLVQTALYEFSKDLLKDKPNFFVPNLLNTTAKILGIISKEEILWNIYQMIRDKLIVYKNLEFQRDEIETKEQEKKTREYEIQKLLEIKSIQEIVDETKKITIEDAQKKMEFYLEKGKIAEKNAAYQEALNEYQKALTYAKEFKMETEIGKIAYRILEIIKLNKRVELDFAFDQAIKAEKKKDYIKALKYLFQMQDILRIEYDSEIDYKRIERIDQRITKLQNLLR